MAVYRQIHITYWQDPFIENLGYKEKYFYLYLLTNSKTTQSGCYEISKKLISYETGLDIETIEQLLDYFIKEDKIAISGNEILLKNWLKHNSFSSPKIKKCIDNELIKIKDRVFIEYIYSILDFGITIHTQPQKEKEKEKEKEEEQKEEKKELKNNIFIPPTILEIKNYLQSKNINSVDAEKFYYYYESNGWKVGKNKMRSWQSAIHTWNKSSFDKSSNRSLSNAFNIDQYMIELMKPQRGDKK